MGVVLQVQLIECNFLNQLHYKDWLVPHFLHMKHGVKIE